MAVNIIKRTWHQNQMVKIEPLNGFAFQAESGGHTFQISGVDDSGNAVPISGTIAGVFLRPDNTDVALTGSASGGVASVTLKAECYAVPGRFLLTVYATSGSNKGTIYAAMGTVSRTSSGAVSPAAASDVVDLVNRINAATATIPASYTTLLNAVAGDYSDTKTYAVKDFVWYNGHLYRCTTAITTAETWTASHWTQVVLADALNQDITDLKSAIIPLYGEAELELVNGSYWLVSGANAGNPLNYVGWSRTDRIKCTPGEILKITATVRSQYNLFFNSDTDGDMNSAFMLNVGENSITVPTGATYFALSNTTSGMNGTEVVKIISADEVKNIGNNANEALIDSANNTRSIENIEHYVGFKPSSAVAEITSLVALTAINRRTDYFPTGEIKAIGVNAVSGYQHNINYFKVSASDSDAVAENGWQNDCTSFTKPDGYLYWYIRFRKADQSTFTDSDVNTLLASLVVTLNYNTINIPKQTVYVSTTGADTNDGSKSAPFATLQKAVDSGALVVKASPGNYTGFSVQNREAPLTIMLDSMPVYSTDNPEVPKIKITTGVSGGYGIYAVNCTEINLFDVWVDGVTADCMWLQDIGNVNCTRCFVSNNSADNSMGIRLISVNGVFRDCKAWNIVKDGFNIHRYGNTQFINCVAYDCGDDGISHHDGCTGLISGGEYYRCYKGGISSPYGGSKIDIDNVYIHDCTQYGIYSMSTSEMLKSSGRISNCVIKNNGTFDIIATYTDLIGWNNIYDTKSVGTQATFTEF